MSIATDEKGVKSAEFWEPRRALTLDAARRHSSFIRIARQVLLACAALLAGLLVWYFVSAPKTTPMQPSADETVKMVNPIYKGRTSDGLAYRIIADVAVRFLQKPDEVTLSKPVLNFLRTAGVDESKVFAQSGVYNSKDHILDLRKNVNLKTDEGHECQTEHSLVFIKDKRIIGDASITCMGSFGTASGHAYEVNNNYTEFVYKDGMTARLIPKDVGASLRGASSVSNTKSPQMGFDTNKAVDVAAQKAVYTGPKIVLTEKVDIRQEDTHIRAKRIDLYREIESTSDEGKVKYGNINRMVATGAFRYEDKESMVSGHKGVYERDKNIITVTGENGTVRYTQENGNTVSGCKLVYDLTKSRATFDGRCGAKTSGGRVIIRTGQ
ncbi:MAG: LPS export ABC transporter periplasmic protein LptC [Robiginitomaculum sp.]|nr:MAG: LPS export ABC transporter periplasmic protein LptC [Robiginitomaculum sp.]